MSYEIQLLDHANPDLAGWYVLDRTIVDSIPDDLEWINYGNGWEPMRDGVCGPYTKAAASVRRQYAEATGRSPAFWGSGHKAPRRW